MTDAELVARQLAGDRSALAAIYDRYADSLYDTAAAMTGRRHDAADILQDVFVAATERMGQLRDPSKLKPWLFAILRNEVYRRSGRRHRTVPTDFTDPVAEMSAPTQPPDEGSGVEYEELAALVRAAAAGLDERDQLVLELSVRQGLQGDDLAAALGVSANQCYGLVHRMRQRTERSLGAYCVARAGRKDCPELAELLRGWDGEFSVLIRKRVARHVDGCEVCERSRRTLAPFALLGAAPVMAAPIGLRDRVLAATNAPHPEPSYGFDAPGGFPSAVRHARRLALWIMVTATLVFLGLGAAVYVLADDDPSVAIENGTTTTTAVPPVAGAAPSPTGQDGAADGAAPTAAPANPPPATTAATNATASGATSTTTSIAAAGPVSTVVGTTIPSEPAASPPAPSPSTTSTPATTTPVTTVPTTSTAPTTTTAIAPGVLSVSAGSIDFGTMTDEAAITLANTGGQPVDWSATSGPASFRTVSSPFTFVPSSGSLSPGASVRVVVTLDRSWPTEGQIQTRRITFAATGTRAVVDLDGAIARPPTIRPLVLPPSLSCVADIGVFTWEIAIADESPPVSGEVELIAPDGLTLPPEAFTERAGTWHARIDAVNGPGTWTWTVRAADAFGNESRLTGETVLTLRSLDC